MSTAVAPDDAAHTGTPRRRGTLLAGMTGNVMEWYDFALFGYFAPVIAKLFFPSGDAAAALLSTFGIFAAGFLMRPVGAAIFGHFGDRVGRRQTLAASVLLMAIPTGLMGLLPTHQEVGLLAPLLLTVLRLLQGLSVGGEYTSSITFLVEHAERSRRGLVGSWAGFSAGLGILLGSGAGALLSQLTTPEQLEAWAWRIPFLVGILLGGVGLYLRMGIEETPSFQALAKSGAVARFPLLETLRHHRKELLTVVGLLFLNAVSFYLIFVYLTTYLSDVVHMPLRDALVINTLSMVVLCAAVPLMGLLSDRFGRRAPQLLGAAGFLGLSYPLFVVLSRGQYWGCLLAMGVFAVLQAAVSGPLPTMLVEIFPTRARCTSLSVGYNLALGLFGGSAPLVATFLVERTGSILSPSLYLTLSAAVTLGVLWTLRETYREPLR